MDKNAFDWNHARVFLTVANMGSLTAAADAHDLSQSTLSRQMSSLEAQLGLTLFERMGRGIQVTEAGHQLIRYIEVMQEAATQISLNAKGQSESLHGSITLAVSELDAAFRIPPIVKRIREQAPELQLNIKVSNAMANLKTHEADIAIRNKRPEQADLITRKLAMEPIDVFGTQEYVSQLEQTDYKNVQIIGFDQQEEVIEILNRRGWSVGVENFQVTTGFQWLHVALARQGNCLVILPTDIGNSLGFKAARRTAQPLLELPIWLVSHRELRTNPRVRFVFDQLATGLDYNDA
ncbi:LysR family transcriptional regulator [Marinomonas atlantica]|uniref:LysR family transcriptional regulator n=1 Tax=Marinomonas atlantica TaxID=1806668 RepID=UPI00082BDA3E|nr:LysR family transcriptional regulator [Marinomonas atlantica]